MSNFEETKRHHDEQYSNLNFDFSLESGFFNTPLVKEFLTNPSSVSDPKIPRTKKVNSNDSNH